MNKGMRLILFYIVGLIEIINCQQYNINGKYCRSNSFQADEFSINADSTFSYRYFYDVGGWSRLFNGQWARQGDTIILNSSILPDVKQAKEENDSGMFVIITIKEEDLHFFEISDMRIFPSMKQMRLYESDSLDSYWSIDLPYLAKGDTIVFDVSNISVRYAIQSILCNRVTISLNLNKGNYEFFFRNHRLIYKKGELIRQEESGAFDYEHPFILVDN